MEQHSTSEIMIPDLVVDIAEIVEDSIVDGPGLRAVIFVQGCPHHCDGCHNPRTHPFGTGRKMTIQEIFHRIRKNPLQRGVTFSGGEPFCQSIPLAALATLFRQSDYEIAACTGYTLEHLLSMNDPSMMTFLQQTDILIDGPFVQSQKDQTLSFRGSWNQRILDVHESLRKGHAVLCETAAWNPG